MPLSHILRNTQNHKQKCFNSIQYENLKIKLKVSENKPTKLHSRVVNDDYLWSFINDHGIAVTVFLPNFSATHHSIATQGSIWMTCQQFRALKVVWPKPDVATPTNRSAIFNQKFKAGNLFWASLVESQWRGFTAPGHLSTASNPQTHERNPFSPLLPATLNISSGMTRFFSFSLPPNPAFIFARLTTCHCHITATLAVLETWPL